MTKDGDPPKDEFTNFLDDIADEITHRVESITRPKRREEKENRTVSEERHVLDWPNVVDRMIDEMR